MSDDRSRRRDRYRDRPRSVLTGDETWTSSPADAEPMYPSGWTLERELRERRQGAQQPPRAQQTQRAEQAQRAPARTPSPPPPPTRPSGPSGPPPAPERPQRPESPHRRQPTGPSSRDRLREALASPGAARQAFLLREVLGPPVALRTDRDDRPG